MDSAGINKLLPAHELLPNTRLLAVCLAAPPCDHDSRLWKVATGQKEKGTGSYGLLPQKPTEEEINTILGRSTDSSDHTRNNGMLMVSNC